MFLAKLIVSILVGVVASIMLGAASMKTFAWSGGATAVLLFVLFPIVRKVRKHKHSNIQSYDGGLFPDAYTVIDIETTGLNPQSDEITELAAIRIHGGKVVDTFQELVAINGTIPKDVAEKTHITDDMLVRARPVNEVLRDYLSFVGDDILVGYNINNFDLPFISYHANKVLGASLSNNTIDVWELVIERCPGLPNYRLDTLRKVYGIDSCGAHRALKDCCDTNLVYQALKTREGHKGRNGIKTPTSIYRMKKSDFKERFGEAWMIAAEIVARKKESIASGIETNWDVLRAQWNPATLATEAQIAMLVGAGVVVKGRLSKRDASLMIDEIMLEREVAREVGRRKAQEEKEAIRVARQAERDRRRELRENERAAAQARREARAAEIAAKKAAREAEQMHYDGPRMKVSTKRLAMWRDEFTSIWNGILSDDVIEVAELKMLKNWLNRHKRRRDDFYTMLKLIDDVTTDGVVTPEEAQQLYVAAVEVLDALSLDSENSVIDKNESVEESS